MVEMKVIVELDKNGKPVIKEYDRCLRCGRKLKDDRYRKIGFGPICIEKVRIRKYKKLF